VELAIVNRSVVFRRIDQYKQPRSRNVGETMRILYLVAAAAIGALALAACGSGGGGSYAASSSQPIGVAAESRAPVTTADTMLGATLVDASGHTLYGRTADTNGVSSCDGACTSAWPPVTVASASLPPGLDAKLFSVVTRSDGSHQLKAGQWPLYRFAGDAAPGDINGQGSAGVWFAATPTGALHKS
jgi:predicted lipoprotein with Yx(FWY)xxD motif